MATSKQLARKKAAKEKISMLTCYDHPTAVWEDEAGIDVIFVGDSLGTNVLGYGSEREVTLDDIAHHLRAVRRGVSRAYLLADLPYMTYETPEDALRSASVLISSGADGVKLEGFRPAIVERLVKSDIEVCAHLGFNPQIHDRPGLQAKTAAAGVQLINESLDLQQAGAWMIVYELIPEEVAKEATDRLTIPTIGIGAGRYTDGQVLIVSDMLGVNAFDLRHVHKYETIGKRAVNAIRQYVSEVHSGEFPRLENVRRLSAEEKRAFQEG